MLLKLTPGNTNDIKVAESLLEPFSLVGKSVLADRGYDSKKFVRFIEERGGTAIIPCRHWNKEQRVIDKQLYNKRHLVENLFLNLKNHRRFATRYEKSAASFLALSLFAASLFWLS